MKYYFPFGEELKPLKQQDRTPKKVFVLGVYASAVHARWATGPRREDLKCAAMAVASEPRIFWDGNPEEAAEIISRIKVPKGLGTLKPAGKNLNGPSAKVLDEHILAPLGFTRKDAWLCDLLPETRLNSHQAKVIKDEYNPYIKDFGLNEVTIPERPNVFCDKKRCKEIVAEIEESKSDMLVLLGDIPIKQFLNVVAEVDYNSLLEYKNQYGYGIFTETAINGKIYKILPLAHPRQIGALGGHSENWYKEHKKWEENINKKTMATFYEYKCKGCGYTVNANPKGKDMVMMGEIHNYLCQDCKEIVEVLYPYGKEPEKIVCPECGSDHLKKWNPKTCTCPKCGGDMEKTDVVLMVD